MSRMLIVGLLVMVVALGVTGCLFRSGSPELPAALGDLPLIEIPARKPSTGDDKRDIFAVMLSGDGGWRGLDKAVGQQIAAHGIPVVGWSSLRYYWHKRTPASAAADLARVIDTYASKWHKRRVVLIGYSRGADVMPFLYNRLPASTQARVEHIVLLGLASHITFYYRLLSWIGLGPRGTAVLPEARQLPADRVSCLYGVRDPDAVCDALDGSGFNVIAMAGGHHFGGHYAKLAHTVLEILAPR